MKPTNYTDKTIVMSEITTEKVYYSSVSKKRSLE